MCLHHVREILLGTSAVVTRHVLEEESGGVCVWWDGAEPRGTTEFHTAWLALEEIQRRNRP